MASSDIRNSLALKKVDNHIWTSDETRLEQGHGARGVFGGQVISQALLAATNCAPPEFALHSTHCYFLASASSSTPLVFLVTPLRKGRSFLTYTVSATQSSIPVFFLSCSFKIPEPRQPDFHIPMPKHVVPPEKCIPREILYQKRLDSREDLSEDARKTLQIMIDERRDSPVEIMDASFPGQSSHHGAFWLRARGISKEQLAPPLQKIVLAYLSDFNFIGTVQKALGLSSLTRPDPKALRLGMMVSLDHVIWYYDDAFDAADWMLHVMEVSRAGSGRGTVHGRVYAQDGRLIAVTSQEGVVRARL